MTGDMLMISPETLKTKLPDCKDGEDVSITVKGTLMISPEGAMMHYDPASMEKAYSEDSDKAAPMAEVSPGAAAILSRGK